MSYFSPASGAGDFSIEVPSPFSNTPHPLAKQAAELLQVCLLNSFDCPHDFHAADGGKMLGVLVVRDTQGQLAFLSGFSGMLAGQWLWPDFVPPVFDVAERASFLPAGEARLAEYAEQIFALQTDAGHQNLTAQLDELARMRDVDLAELKLVHKQRKALRRELRVQCLESADVLKKLALESQRDKREQKTRLAQWAEKLSPLQERSTQIENKIAALKKTRAQLSNQLHEKIFATYRLSNQLGEHRSMADFFDDGLPPGGAGDCAGPKLVHYACQHNLTPLALAEFWWGASAKEGVRHHGRFYPACRGKCRPILPFMLRGYPLQAEPRLGECVDAVEPQLIYEDADLLVVDKPSGLLSVPGTVVTDSVQIRLQQRYPEATGLLLVHRLDLSTSGLLLVAKNAATHKFLQKQFLQRRIEKRYVALLSKRLADDLNQGMIDLPLWVDYYDRPRQKVCFSQGKPAQTRWQVIAREAQTTRVYFYPVTGRTHQLRVHASHQDGLNAPIKGDELYGDNEGRLRLHAERLCFTHPQTKQRIELFAPVPF